MDIDRERTTSKDVSKIGSTDVAIKDVFKGPIIINDLVKSQFANTSIHFAPRVNDHEAISSSTSSKYLQPRWCPSDITRTHKRKLQTLTQSRKKAVGT